MEKAFLTWKGWDQHDTMVFGFSRCTVTKAFGPYEVGAELETVCVDYDKGVIEVWVGGGDTPVWTGKLVLTIGDDQ